MSDRTPGSVRTGSRPGDGPGGTDGSTRGNAPAGSGSASKTQAIPTTGAVRAQGAAQGRAPATGSGAAQGGAPRTSGGAPAVGAGVPVTSGPAVSANAPAAGKARGRGGRAGRAPRRAKLQLRHVDTWSAFKISLVLSIALFFIWMVAVGVLYGVLSGLGVFNTLNDLFGQLGTASGSKGGGSAVITPGLVFGGAAVIGAVNIVLLTALGTVATFIYNLCSDLVGGLEVTLSERD